MAKKTKPRLIASVVYHTPHPRAGERMWNGKGYVVAPAMLPHTFYCTADKVDAVRSEQRYAKEFAHQEPQVSFAFEKPVRKPAFKRDTHPADKVRKHMAIEYAKWLMKRDGVVLPVIDYWSGENIRVDWGYVDVPGHKHGEQRAIAVEWGHQEGVYMEVSKRRRRYLDTQFVPDLRIEIPNWDFVPVEPVEETLDDAGARDG